jgi:hypothetical protein
MLINAYLPVLMDFMEKNQTTRVYYVTKDVLYVFHLETTLVQNVEQHPTIQHIITSTTMISKTMYAYLYVQMDIIKILYLIYACLVVIIV